jgi:serine/threonine protein phosphatase PrpC
LPEGDNDKAHFLRSIIQDAHKVIKNAGKRNPEQRGMGTTIVLVEIDSRGMTLVWSGDSRVYSLSPVSLVHPDRRLGLDRMELLTRDHSLVWDYVESGEITPEEARVHRMSHIITQSLGSDDNVPAPEVGFRNLVQGQRILLCSDGLNGMLTELQIENFLKQDRGLELVVKDLINGANEAGGQDNISVIVLEIELAVECESNNLNVIKNLTTANQIFRKNESFQASQFLTVIFLFVSIIFLLLFIFRYNDINKMFDQFSKKQNLLDTSTVQLHTPKIESDLQGSTLSTHIVTLSKNEDSLRENVKQFENLVRESMTILKRNEENGARPKQFNKKKNEEFLYTVNGTSVKDSMDQLEEKNHLKKS